MSGFLSKIGGGVGAIFGGPGGAVLGSFLGGAADNIFSAHQQADSQAFAREQAKNQMLWRTEDLKRAGLNPMLAVSQGGASTPGGGGTPSMSGFSSAFRNSLEARLLDSQMAKLQAEAGEARGRTLSPGVADRVAEAQAGLSISSAGKAEAETKNLPIVGQHLLEEIQNLKSEIRKRGIESDTMAMLQALQVKQLELENRISAAQATRTEAIAKPFEYAKEGLETLEGLREDIDKELKGAWDIIKNLPKKFMESGNRGRARGH